MLIKDLSKDLDTQAMTAVRGGDNGVAGANTALLQLGMTVPIGIFNGSGSASNNFIKVTGDQDSTQKNKGTSGDTFAAFLGMF